MPNFSFIGIQCRPCGAVAVKSPKARYLPNFQVWERLYPHHFPDQGQIRRERDPLWETDCVLYHIQNFYLISIYRHPCGANNGKKDEKPTAILTEFSLLYPPPSPTEAKFLTREWTQILPPSLNTLALRRKFFPILQLPRGSCTLPLDGSGPNLAR